MDNRERFRQWLESNHLHSGRTAEQVADAAARIWGEPGEAEVKQHCESFCVERSIETSERQWLSGDGSWLHYRVCFPTRYAAESALAAAKGETK